MSDRIYRYLELCSDGDFVVTVTHEEILETEFAAWVGKMSRSKRLTEAAVARDLRYLEELCVDDFAVARWAGRLDER